MTSLIAFIFATMFDFYSLLTILGSMKAKKIWHALLAAVAAAMLGEFISESIKGQNAIAIVSFARLISQIMLALFIFFVLDQVRKRGNQDEVYIKRRVKAVSVLLLILFGLAFGGLLYSGVHEGKRLVSEAKIKAAQASAEIEEDKGFDRPISSSEIRSANEVEGATASLFNYNARASGQKIEQEDDGFVYLYREPVEGYWNDWQGKFLEGNSIHIKGIGKTASFSGVVRLNCDSREEYVWDSAYNALNRRFSDKEVEEIVPAKVILAAFSKFCR